jgi:DNA-binding CsgD family transcriptional regulator
MPRKGSLTPSGKLVRRYVRVPARRLSAEMTEKLIRTRERQAQALDLKRAGATYEEIAKALGYSHRSSARQAVKAAIDRIGIESAVDVVGMDLMRLDEFQKRLTAAMRAGDLGVIPTLMQVMRERRALVGWTPETWSEEQRKGQGIQNNGVMVIQGGSAQFIEGMMRAIGVDPKSEEAQKHLARVREEEEKAGTGEFAITAPRPNELAMANMADSALNTNEGQVIQGEVVRLEEKDVE